MRVAAVLLAVFLVACETCPYRAVELHDSETQSLACCDAVVAFRFHVPFNDADVDVLVSNAAGQPTQVEAWLTLENCDRLFDTGSSTPRCDVLIGPVASGTTSVRRRSPSGFLKIWARQRTPSESAVSYFVGATVWRHQCNVGPG